MMPVLSYVLLCLVLSILESSLLSFFPMELFKPDLGLPLVIYAALFLEPATALIVALLTGICQEVFSSAPHGTMVFTKVAVFLVTVFLKRNLYIDSRYSFAFACSCFVLVESLLYLLLAFFARGDTSNVVNVLFYAVPNAIFTGFIAMFLRSFLDYLNMRLLGRG
jgi:rod shape-determining protein MreD